LPAQSDKKEEQSFVKTRLFTQDLKIHTFGGNPFQHLANVNIPNDEK
jgi:hypothetical protein